MSGKSNYSLTLSMKNGVADFATASPETQAQYLQDQNTSIAMWHQLNLPDFNIRENSFGESTRAEYNSAPYNGDLAGTQEPLMSSMTPLPSFNGDVSSMRPSSVMQATAVPPNIPSGNRIARPEGKGKISAVRSNTLENG